MHSFIRVTQSEINVFRSLFLKDTIEKEIPDLLKHPQKQKNTGRIIVNEITNLKRNWIMIGLSER